MSRSPSLPLLWKFLFTLAALAALTAHPRDALAQDSTACDSCGSCTSALGTPRARVHIERDLEIEGTGSCVVISGAGANFDARGHTIHGNAATNVAVQITGAAVLVRNLHATGPGIGVDVDRGERATIYHGALETHDIGVRVTSATSVRIVRTQIRNARVGVAFGQANGTTCAPAAMASPGAVISRSVFERNGTAIVACDAAPVLTDNVVVRNRIGIVMGEPTRAANGGPGADAPYDPCLCAAPLDHVAPPTTVFYSSGCGGCQTHEAWMPDLARSGHDIRVRETGLEHQAEGQRFDDYVAQCVPEISDALGIPGCVPNYACPASDTVYKNRAPGDELRFEARLESSEDVAHFAEACATFARQHYRGTGASCVRHAVRGNVVCSNAGGDIVASAGARRFGGAGNSCGTANGWTDEGASGCAQPCPSTLPASADAPSPTGEPAPAHVVAPTNAAEPAPTANAPTPSPSNPAPAANAPASANANAEAATPAENNARSNGMGKMRMAVMIACLVGIAGLVGFALRKGS